MKKGWQTKTLGELCRIRTGKKDVNEGNPDGEFPFFTCAAEHTFSDNYSFDTEALLIAGNGDVGKVSYYNGKFEAYQRTYVLSDFTEVLPRYLFLILDGKLKDTVSKQKLGNTMPYIKVGMLTDFHLPVPPLAEQQRIVGLLDEAFEGLATAKANAEKNLQNARALFESHLQSVFTQRGPGWVEKRLGGVVTRLTNGFVGPTRNIYHESGVPYLLARHVKNNRLLFDGRTFISDEFNRKNKKSMLKAGDVLLVQSGHIGHSAVVTKEHEGHNCHAMIVITAVEGAFLGPFLSLFFNSSGMKQKFQEIRSGSTVPHLTCGEVRELMIPMPDLATQRRVVDHSQELDEETQRLARLYERKLAALEALKKSLLHQAFTGEL